MNMQSIKYHSINIICAAIFSFVLSLTINQIVKGMLTISPSEARKSRITVRPDNRNINVDMGKLLESGFFKVSTGTDGLSSDSGESASQMSDLKLLGTVTGPPGIARAMIMKRGEKQAEIFKLWKEVYGYTLV